MSNNITITDNTVEVTVTYKGVYETESEMIEAVKSAKTLKAMAVDETELLEKSPNDLERAA